MKTEGGVRESLKWDAHGGRARRTRTADADGHYILLSTLPPSSVGTKIKITLDKRGMNRKNRLKLDNI